MYESYFGLVERPFSIAPDPQYLYMSARHKEAMAHLSYGLSQGGCFIVLTGEVGTGKTTLCRNLLMDLPDNVDVALILNANINEMELLQTICDELKIDYHPSRSQKQLLDAINHYLLDTFANNRHTVLIIDEAQLLSRDVLEQIRLLTNLETTKNKLLQIILIGQPELSDMLTRNDLRQLAQRVTARYHLGALKHSEIEEYVNFRLSVAGCRQPLFTKQALSKLHQVTEGIPRKINVLADHALLSAFAQSQQNVDAGNIKHASEEVFFTTKPDKKGAAVNPKWWALVAGVLLLNIALWWFFSAKDNTVVGSNQELVAESQELSLQGVVDPVVAEDVLVEGMVGEVIEESQVLNPVEELLDLNSIGSLAIEPVTIDPVESSVEAQPAIETALPDPGSVSISNEFLDADDGVVETVRNPEVMQDIDFTAESIASTIDAQTVQKNNLQAVMPETEFGRILETSADVTGRITVFRRLVELWGVSLPDQILNPVCTEAASNGLQCLGVGNWPQLRRYNRPAMMVLVHDGQLHRVIIETISDDAAEVRVGDSVYRVGVDELQRRWNGASLTVWRPSDVGSNFLQQGDNGSSVANVRAYLNKALAQTKLPIVGSVSNTLFDRDLSQKVFALQINFGIISDSKIGNETYLLMNELVAPESTPVLNQRVR